MTAQATAHGLVSNLLAEIRRTCDWDQAVGDATSTSEVHAYGKYWDATRTKAEMFFTVLGSAEETDLCIAIRRALEDIGGERAITMYGPVPFRGLDDNAWRILGVVPMPKTL